MTTAVMPVRPLKFQYAALTDETFRHDGSHPWVLVAAGREFAITLTQGWTNEREGEDPTYPAPGEMALEFDVDGPNGSSEHLCVWTSPAVVEQVAHALLATIEESKRLHPESWPAAPVAPVVDDDAAMLEALREAIAIEKAGGDWKIKHVMAVLNCARSTVYETPYLRKLRKRVGKRALRWTPKEVRAYQALISGGGRV